jgi:hypothetical protein
MKLTFIRRGNTLRGQTQSGDKHAAIRPRPSPLSSVRFHDADRQRRLRAGNTVRPTGAAAREPGGRRRDQRRGRDHRHRPEEGGESPERPAQHPGFGHAAARRSRCLQLQRLYQADAERLLPDDAAGRHQRLYPRRRLGRRRQPFGLAAKRRRLSRRAAGDDDRRHARRPYLRHRPDRGAARAAGHALRRLFGSRDDPHHHQQARQIGLLRRRRRRAERRQPRRRRRQGPGLPQHAARRRRGLARRRLVRA